MDTIQQTVIIPADRRLQLDLTLPDNIPAGQAEMLVVLSPAKPTTKVKGKAKSIRHLAGRLACSAALAGGPVTIQKAMRDEW